MLLMTKAMMLTFLKVYFLLDKFQQLREANIGMDMELKWGKKYCLVNLHG